MERSLTIDGVKHLVSSDDKYLSEMESIYEPHMVSIFKALIGPDDVVADIGANIGLTSILFSSLAKHVYSFEPSASTFEILKANLDRAKVKNVVAVNLGIGERKEQSFITYSSDNRSGAFVSDKINLTSGHVTEGIEIDSLENFLTQAPFKSVNFLKIDTEGFEANVLKGSLEVLARDRPTVVLELNHFCLNVMRRMTVPDFFDFLKPIFPILYAIDGNNAEIANLHDPSQAYHVMHQHIVHGRFPNLVAGFDGAIVETLKGLERQGKELITPPPPIRKRGLLCSGRMNLNGAPKRVKQGQEFWLDATIINKSTSVWSGASDGLVRLSYHWMDLTGNVVVFDGERSDLGASKLFPGQKLSTKLKIIAPFVSRHLVLVVSLVSEGRHWFEEQGFVPAELPITITSN